MENQGTNFSTQLKSTILTSSIIIQKVVLFMGGTVSHLAITKL